MKISIVTFGDEKWSGSLDRLEDQLKNTELFENIVILNKNSIDKFCPEWHIENLNLIEEKKDEGYGGYIWKAYLVEKMFSLYPDSDYFIYMDSGTEININYNENTRKRFLEYIEYANKNNVFCFKNRDTEEMFTHCDEINLIFSGAAGSRGHHAGFLIFKNNQICLNLVKDWKLWGTKDNYKHLFQIYDNAKCCDIYFRGLHDQSIFSCLLKSKGMQGLDDEADWYHEGYSIFNDIEDNMSRYPLFFARNFKKESVLNKCVVYNKQVKHMRTCQNYGTNHLCESTFISKIDKWHTS